ncbi:MAG: class I SAM-dependent methyltransferase, partial [Myxococcota bacterium]
MSQRDFDKWETLYAKPDDAPPRSPESFALRCAKTVSPGHAVDIAGGTGRHARALIELGWKVTLIDIAPSALKRARASLGANADKLKTVAVDLEQTTEALSPATFD